MPRPTRNEIYDAVIRKMVLQALEEQEQGFIRDHASDSDEQLLNYIKEQAAILCYTPRYKEIIGWQLIEQRFGSWENALRKANLRICSSCAVNKLPRIQQELERQKAIYRQRKAEKKEKSFRRRMEQEQKAGKKFQEDNRTRKMQ
jgi:hypothetical protein